MLRKGYFDIEMAPAVVHSWGLFDQNHGINQVISDPYMLCFAWRWEGSKTKIFKSIHHNGVDDMVNTLWKLMDEADAIVSWNGARYDTGHSYREFKKLGLTPPSPHKEIDLFQTARSRFNFLSNKLDYVAQYLGLGKKESTGGHELWTACMAGDEAAWRRMKKYNIQDVDLLVDIDNELLPWAKNRPNINLFQDSNGCPYCGSEDYQKRGFAHTGIASYQRYSCNNCRAWFKDGKAIQRSDFRQL